MDLDRQRLINVVLADDDSDDCFLFNKALSEIPMATHLIILKNGEHLMEHLTMNADHPPDILFLDLSMPRKTGFECLSEIKENDKLKDIPVFVLTTSYLGGMDYEQNLINALYRFGARDYIRKPVEFEKLKELIIKAIIQGLAKDGALVPKGENIF